MKKILVLMICVILCVSFVGCSTPTPSTEESTAPNESAEATSSPSATQEATIEPSSESSPEPSAVSVDSGSFDVKDVNTRFFAAQVAIEEMLSKETTLTQANGLMELKQNEENPSEYKVFLPVGSANIYYWVDDAGEAQASALVVDDTYADEYYGKTAVASMGLAFIPLQEGETLVDRLGKIDTLNPSQGNFIAVGDILEDAAMINAAKVEGFSVYVVIKAGLAEEVNEQILNWVGAVTQNEIDSKE